VSEEQKLSAHHQGILMDKSMAGCAITKISQEPLDEASVKCVVWPHAQSVIQFSPFSLQASVGILQSRQTAELFCGREHSNYGNERCNLRAVVGSPVGGEESQVAEAQKLHEQDTLAYSSRLT